MKSIIQEKKECWCCHTTYNLECHHIYGAGCRKNAEKYGLKVWLCNKHHTGVEGVHNGNHALDRQLRILGQLKFEKTHSREEFIRLFIRSNL